MIPIKAVTRLEFATALPPWIEFRSLLRAAQGAESGEVQGQPIRIDRAADKQRITLQVRALSVESEADGDARALLDPVLRTVGALNAAVPFPELTGCRFEMLFVDPFELPFHALVASMRSSLLAAIPLTEAATDLQVVLDEQIDEQTTRHTQLGPMLPEQLTAQFLAFPHDQLPPQFVFAGLASTIARVAPFDEAALSRSASEFSDWALIRSAEVSVLLRG